MQHLGPCTKEVRPTNYLPKAPPSPTLPLVISTQITGGMFKKRDRINFETSVVSSDSWSSGNHWRFENAFIPLLSKVIISKPNTGWTATKGTCFLFLFFLSLCSQRATWKVGWKVRVLAHARRDCWLHGGWARLTSSGRGKRPGPVNQLLTQLWSLTPAVFWLTKNVEFNSFPSLSTTFHQSQQGGEIRGME